MKNCDVWVTQGTGANGDGVVQDPVRAGTTAVARTVTREAFANRTTFVNRPAAFVRTL